MDYRNGDKFNIQLMSDLHLGASSTNEKSILRELDRAKEIGARININGDLFDGILPKDMKRYQPEVIAQGLQGKDDLINQTVEYVCDFLKPYQHLIDGIGMGNHEFALLSHHNINLITWLITRLNQDSDHKTLYLGYSGFLTYRFTYATSNGKVKSVCIYYHHGTGGGTAPVTKGVIQFNRSNTWIEGADVIWLGHNHERMSVADVKVAPDQNGNPSFREIRCVRTGSYANFIDNGYPVKGNMKPQSHGGALLVATLLRDGKKIEVLQ